MKKLSIYFFVFFCLSTVLCGETSKDLFERAAYHEETSGDLNKAIELYSRCQTLSQKQPGLAAKALYHRAHCYLKSGDLSKANELFSQLLEKYPQQQAITSQVLKHLVMPDAPKQPRSELQSLLAEIVPRFQCTDVSLGEVIELLRQSSKQLDPLKHGLNMIILPGIKIGKKYNFDFENMPLAECMKHISLASGLKYKIEEDLIVFASKDAVLGNFETKSYYISNGLREVMTDDKALSFTENCKDYFQLLGVRFPVASTVFFSEGINRLFVYNIKDEQKRLSDILSQIDVDAAQFKIRTQFIEVDDNSSLKSLPVGSLSYKELMQIPASGRRTIASLSCFTQSGNTSIVRDVEPYEGINDKGEKDLHEFGTILEFTPVVNPDGVSIELDYRGVFSEMDNGTLKAVTVDTRFLLYDSVGILMQVQDKGSEKENKRNLYLYLQVDLTNMEGGKKN
jgi:hypothetical protein